MGRYISRFFICFGLGITAVLLCACLGISTPIPTLPLPTKMLPTETITPTIVWFPPTATSTLAPTQAITPTLDVRPNIGEIIFKDDFTSPEIWDLAVSESSSVALGLKEITLAISQPNIYLFSLRKNSLLDDFYAEVTASPSLCWGDDEYGLLFRVTPSLDFYRFSLSCNGAVRLDKYIAGKASSPYPKTLSGAVPPGAPSSSRLSIWVKGKEMHFFINGEFQFTINDPSIPEGNLGVFARSSKDSAITVSFSDLIVREVIP